MDFISPAQRIVVTNSATTQGTRALTDFLAQTVLPELIDGGRLYGLGRADAKLDWLAKAAAIERLHGQAFIRPLVFTGTYGEERGTSALVCGAGVSGGNVHAPNKRISLSQLERGVDFYAGLIATFCLNDSLPYT